MKKLLIGLCILLLALPAFAKTVSFSDKELARRGWSIHVMDDDIDTTAELITELDTTYAQMSPADQIEVLSSYDSTDEDVTVTIVGIDNSGNRISEDLDISGSTAVLSTATFRFVEQAYADSEPIGVITVQDEDDTFITSIPAGALESSVLQRFTGEKNTYITGWWASALTSTGTVRLELRWYPDDDDCLSPDVAGYKVLDEIYIDSAVTSPYSPAPHVFAQPIELPSGGWMAVYGTGGAVNADAAVTVQGFDLN